MKKLLATLAFVTVTACSGGAHTSSPSGTVLLVHGFNGYGSFDCHQLDQLKSELGGHVLTVGLYAKDKNCDVPGLAGATVNTSITTLAEHLRVLAQGEPGPITFVGHSMGGLIASAAHAADTRVIALGTPFGGLPSALSCPQVVQCQEMTAGSEFLRALRPTPTLCIGSTRDEVVPIDSALVAGCQRKSRVNGLSHGQLLSAEPIARQIRQAVVIS